MHTSQEPQAVKVVLVHDWLTGMRGGEKCLEVLCRRFPDADLLTLLHARGATSNVIERMRITTSFLQHVPGVTRHYRYLLPLMPRAVESLRVPSNADLVVSFSHAVAKSIRVPAGIPHVCYCFTPMRYAWRMRGDYLAAAENEPRLKATVRRAVVRAQNALLDRIRRWDRDTSDRVTHYVAISQTVADRIQESYGRESSIIHPPVDTQFYTASDTPREDFYLCLSALVPYKKVGLAVEACQQLGRRLVIIGSGPEQSRLKRGAPPRVEFLGWQPDEVLRDHLRRCRALLFPGHEDFGIVPIEAQACGAPVIAFARGGATETVLGAGTRRVGTGVFFDEQSPESLADAIRWLEAHPAQVSARLARQHALKFNQARYERELVGFLEHVLRRPLRLAA